jgi:branched-subunit amino acid transport protein
MSMTASLAQNLDTAFAIQQGWGAWLALLAASLGTYVCRAVGVMLSGQVSQDSEFFRWLSAVTYAMVAALTIRLIFLPIGLLATAFQSQSAFGAGIAHRYFIDGHNRGDLEVKTTGVLCV